MIENNIKSLKPQDYIVLKSDAYGFGFKEVLDIAANAGMYKFCVIDIKDAIYIKLKYPNSRVLLLGIFDDAFMHCYEKYQIEISINDLSEFDKLKTRNIPFQLAINTGMNRFGIAYENVTKALQIIQNNELKITGIYTHNATKNKRYIYEQLKCFFVACQSFKNIDIHFASSSLNNLDIPFVNSKRVADMLFNGALQVYGKIIKINYVLKNKYIGYDYAYKMKSSGYVGIIDIGYADGLERNCNGFLVYINNRYYSLIGKACMNYSFVLIDDNVKTNDLVNIISSSNNISNYLSYFGKINHQVYLSFLATKEKICK